MTRDSNLIGLLEDYLDDFEGHTPLPDATRDAIRARLPSTTQRPAWWPGWRFPEMNTMMKYGLGAAAAVLVALVGFGVVSGGGGNFGSPDPTQTPEPSVTALTGQAHLVAGRYSIESGISMRVTAAVPSGWAAVDHWGVRGALGYEAPDGMGVRFYTVGNLLNNPGSYADGLQDPPVGPTVDDLIEAIGAQTEWTSSTPSDATIGGYPAQHVRITIPDGATFDAREAGGAFYLFQDEGSGQIWGLEVGQMFDVYVVDVDGERLVIDAFHYPGTSEADLAALEAVVNSIQIDPES
jgi:hypothetical protein